MFKCKASGQLKCKCKNKSWHGKSHWQILRHHNSPSHMKWQEEKEKTGQEQSRISDAMAAKKEEEEARSELVGTRKSSLTPEDIEYCESTLKAFLRCGIPLNKLDGPFRDYLQKYSQQALVNRVDLARGFLPDLVTEETKLQREELKDRLLSIVYDATPRQGDCFALVVRFMELDPNLRIAFAKHVLIHVSTLDGSMNAESLSAEVTTALTNRRIWNDNVPASAMDRCYTNSASATEMNEGAEISGALQRFNVYCFSHMICNAGGCAAFILLELFWSYIQKIFSQSTQAQNDWEEVTGTAWPTYSETRWFSMYDVLEKLSKLFPDLLTVITRVAAKKVSPANSAKLLALLLDPLLSRKLKIQLASYVEVLFPLRNLCYWLESDATDLPFRVGEKIESFQLKFPGGSMMNLPSTEKLIMEVSISKIYV